MFNHIDKHLLDHSFQEFYFFLHLTIFCIRSYFFVVLGTGTAKPTVILVSFHTVLNIFAAGKIFTFLVKVFSFTSTLEPAKPKLVKDTDFKLHFVHFCSEEKRTLWSVCWCVQTDSEGLGLIDRRKFLGSVKKLSPQESPLGAHTVLVAVWGLPWHSQQWTVFPHWS